jgi:hypothetical protein
MIEIKCTNETCGYALTREQRATDKKRKQKCPLCKALLKRNVSDPIARKQWHCFLSSDKSIVEHSVLVVIDSYSDDSHEIEIPLLRMKFSERDKLQAIYRSAEEIKKFLKAEYGSTYENEDAFITTAFQHETEAAKSNIPIKEMIFIDSDKLPSKNTEPPSNEDLDLTTHTTKTEAKRKKGKSKIPQARLF